MSKKLCLIVLWLVGCVDQLVLPLEAPLQDLCGRENPDCKPNDTNDWELAPRRDADSMQLPDGYVDANSPQVRELLIDKYMLKHVRRTTPSPCVTVESIARDPYFGPKVEVVAPATNFVTVDIVATARAEAIASLKATLGAASYGKVAASFEARLTEVLSRKAEQSGKTQFVRIRYRDEVDDALARSITAFEPCAGHSVIVGVTGVLISNTANIREIYSSTTLSEASKLAAESPAAKAVFATDQGAAAVLEAANKFEKSMESRVKIRQIAEHPMFYPLYIVRDLVQGSPSPRKPPPCPRCDCPSCEPASRAAGRWAGQDSSSAVQLEIDKSGVVNGAMKICAVMAPAFPVDGQLPPPAQPRMAILTSTIRGVLTNEGAFDGSFIVDGAPIWSRTDLTGTLVRSGADLSARLVQIAPSANGPFEARNNLQLKLDAPFADPDCAHLPLPPTSPGPGSGPRF